MNCQHKKYVICKRRNGHKGDELYTDPTHPVGSVLVREPTQDFYYETRKVIGIVYEAYVHKDFKMYGVLFKKAEDCLNMRLRRSSTKGLSEEICCQHLDEHRLSPVNIQTSLDAAATNCVEEIVFQV